ncbi:MAG: hypothetical protein KDC80_03905 [Saprospiraceae bacterium]|nr:hypothetical protein [Saprospiraceae bacterium]
MTHLTRYLIVFIILPLFTAGLLAQAKSKGTLTFEVTDVTTNSPEMQQMVGAMKGMTQKLEFDDKRQKMTMDMMGGMMLIKTYTDTDKKSTETYMDMMGQKIKTVVSNAEIEKAQKEAGVMIKSDDIVYDKSVRKEVMGKDCYKATLQLDNNGQKVNMEMYVTDDIQVPTSFIQNLNQVQLQGTPLMWIIDVGMMKMTFVATEITDDLASDFFSKPEGDYQEMSMEQLKQMGMGGQMGF